MTRQGQRRPHKGSMKIIVQKFGGTSLKSASSRKRAIGHILRAREDGYRVVVIVSAMGRKGDPYATDSLLDWIKQNGNGLTPRELDLLLSCGEIISAATLSSMLQASQVPSVFLTGREAGIITDSTHGSAQIVAVDPSRIMEELSANKVVVVCGFQGGTLNGEITTLGRGGSDTTAAALGVALKAEYVDIFTDVEGIMTADPQIVQDAAVLNRITYQELCHLAYQGAKVIHPRAVEIAMQANLPIRVRSTYMDTMGTLVSQGKKDRDLEAVNDRIVTGITYTKGLSQIKVDGEKHDFNLQLNVFKTMAEHKISVDFINVTPFSLAYTVESHHAEKASRLIRSLGYEVKVTPCCAKVAVVGAGMAGQPGVMAQIVKALTQEEIEILQSVDSHTTIWLLVKEEVVGKAVNALHHQFQLGQRK